MPRRVKSSLQIKVEEINAKLGLNLVLHMDNYSGISNMYCLYDESEKIFVANVSEMPFYLEGYLAGFNKGKKQSAVVSLDEFIEEMLKSDKMMETLGKVMPTMPSGLSDTSNIPTVEQKQDVMPSIREEQEIIDTPAPEASISEMKEDRRADKEDIWPGVDSSVVNPDLIALKENDNGGSNNYTDEVDTSLAEEAARVEVKLEKTVKDEHLEEVDELKVSNVPKETVEQKKQGSSFDKVITTLEKGKPKKEEKVDNDEVETSRKYGKARENIVNFLKSNETFALRAKKKLMDGNYTPDIYVYNFKDIKVNVSGTVQFNCEYKKKVKEDVFLEDPVVLTGLEVDFKRCETVHGFYKLLLTCVDAVVFSLLFMSEQECRNIGLLLWVDNARQEKLLDEEDRDPNNNTKDVKIKFMPKKIKVVYSKDRR